MDSTPSLTLPQGGGDWAPGTDELLYERRGTTAILTFNRPAARNAMTWAMYQGLHDACEHVDADDRVRVLVLRGAGDRAFVAGTDISQFTAFETADDVLTYERMVSGTLSRLEAVQKPTVAMIRGFCVGGGALIAAASDIRIAAPDAQFGVPVSRTLGNIVSTHGFALLVGLIGAARVKELIFTARLATAEEGRAKGVFNEIVPADKLETRALELADDLAQRAPLTLRAAKETIRRVSEHMRPEDFDDLILSCYMSEDFKEGVAAFLEKRAPLWKGR